MYERGAWVRGGSLASLYFRGMWLSIVVKIVLNWDSITVHNRNIYKTGDNDTYTPQLFLRHIEIWDDVMGVFLMETYFRWCVGCSLTSSGCRDMSFFLQGYGMRINMLTSLLFVFVVHLPLSLFSIGRFICCNEAEHDSESMTREGSLQAPSLSTKSPVKRLRVHHCGGSLARCCYVVRSWLLVKLFDWFLFAM